VADKIIERVALNWTDLTGEKSGCVVLGSNKFWIGEVRERADGLFDFICTWGPTGQPGSNKGSVYGTSRSAALAKLRSKVDEKERKGYARLRTRTQADEVAKAAERGIDLATGAKVDAPQAVVQGPLYDPNVVRLLSIIYDTNSSTVRSGLSAQAGATADNPIGNLSDAQLDVGGGLLDDIDALLTRHFGPEVDTNWRQTLPLERNGMPSAAIIDLTNRYMSNIPREIGRERRGRENLHLVVVSSFERLEAERKFLQLLRDAHLSKAAFAAAGQAKTAGDKAHVQYEGLGCDIEFLPTGHKDRAWVESVFTQGQSRKNSNWWSGSSTKLRVANVWRFTRRSSGPSFQAFATRMKAKPGALGNIFAWHGTRTENLLGIGKSGLLMPENLPRGVCTTGKAFGAGVYHAPNWVATGVNKVGRWDTDGTNGALKSINYTSARGAYYGAGNTASGAFMFLQEVALGVPEVCTSSCGGKHRPTGWPAVDWIYACAGGCSTLAHDEVVTFDQNAQVFRYMVEIAVT
jgi:predicted DNA-binding WGR domain protein